MHTYTLVKEGINWSLRTKAQYQECTRGNSSGDRKLTRRGTLTQAYARTHAHNEKERIRWSERQGRWEEKKEWKERKRAEEEGKEVVWREKGRKNDTYTHACTHTSTNTQIYANAHPHTLKKRERRRGKEGGREEKLDYISIIERKRRKKKSEKHLSTHTHTSNTLQFLIRNVCSSFSSCQKKYWRKKEKKKVRKEI